jgi:predicted component of type VI protein secretion system
MSLAYQVDAGQSFLPDGFPDGFGWRLQDPDGSVRLSPSQYAQRGAYCLRDDGGFSLSVSRLPRTPPLDLEVG